MELDNKYSNKSIHKQQFSFSPWNSDMAILQKIHYIECEVHVLLKLAWTGFMKGQHHMVLILLYRYKIMYQFGLTINDMLQEQ